MYSSTPSRSSSRLSAGSIDSNDLSLFRLESLPRNSPRNNHLDIAPQMPDSDGESSSDDDADNNTRMSDSLPGFIVKLYEMFHSKQYQKYCGWSDDGGTILIYNLNEFTNSVIPKFLKTNKFPSFQRQLNMYQFSRVAGSFEAEFRHPFFLKGRRDLLHHISRESRNKRVKRSYEESETTTPARKTPKKIVKFSQGKSSGNEPEQYSSDNYDTSLEKRVEYLENKTQQLSAENNELKKSLKDLKTKVEKLKLGSNPLSDSPYGPTRSNSNEWTMANTAKSDDKSNDSSFGGFGHIFRSFSLGGSWTNGQM